MHCVSCALNIDLELEDAAGVKESSTNYARGETKVVFDERKIKLTQIAGKISTLGYRTSIV